MEKDKLVEEYICDTPIIEEQTSEGYIDTDKSSVYEPVFDSVSQDYEKLIDEANKEAETWKTKYTYLLADLENVKKRNSMVIDKLQKWGSEDIILDLLEVIDDIERALKFDNDNIIIYSKLIALLTKHKVKPIYNERPIFFNDEYDNAVVQIPTSDKELDNTVIEVSKKGYEYNGKVIRYEDVIINKYSE